MATGADHERSVGLRFFPYRPTDGEARQQRLFRLTPCPDQTNHHDGENRIQVGDHRQHVHRSEIADDMSSDVIGYVDVVERHLVIGWAYSHEQPASELIIRVLKKGNEVARGRTQDMRPDVQLRNSSVSKPGFVIKVEEEELVPEDVVVEAQSPLDGAWRELKVAANMSSRLSSSYQSFSDAPGDSPSFEKLAALHLHKILDRKGIVGHAGVLSDLRVLDIGCNEGFFCQACHKLGAAEVVGIDLNPEIVAKATARFPHLTFRHMSWWDLGPDQFDVILFLSAVHYEKSQRDLFDHLLKVLSDDGTLVLECGIAITEHDADRAWTYISRHDQDLRYPSLDYLRNTLLRRYTTRMVGPSANQPGDPMPRFVFHCSPRRTVALVIAGPSFSGKTSLSNALSQRLVRSFSVDNLLARMIERPQLYFRSLLANELQQHSIGAENLEDATQIIVGQGFEAEFSNRIGEELPLDEEIFTIEGQALTDPVIRRSLMEHLSGLGVIAWLVTTERNV